jgi:hypothetical protein
MAIDAAGASIGAHRAEAQTGEISTLARAYHCDGIVPA